MSIKILHFQNEDYATIPLFQDSSQPFATLLDDESNSQMFCCQRVSKRHLHIPLSTLSHILSVTSDWTSFLYILTNSPQCLLSHFQSYTNTSYYPTVPFYQYKILNISNFVKHNQFTTFADFRFRIPQLCYQNCIFQLYSIIHFVIMDVQSFMQLWEDHKVNLLRIAGCFRTNCKFKILSDDCEEQFGGIFHYWF